MSDPLEILYEDNHLLVVNKPAGILTQPSGTDQASLEQRAKDWIKEAYQKPGNVFLEAVHRLDKPASGIVVFGRTSKALSRLNAAIRDKRTEKWYYALVEGVPSKPEGVLENYMIHDDFRAEISDKSDPQAKFARLSYRVVKSSDKVALVEINLETGRYHQIRLQFSAIGCPVVGDSRYGSKLPFVEGAIALHHFRLKFPHPVKEEVLVIESPMPASFSRA